MKRHLILFPVLIITAIMMYGCSGGGSGGGGTAVVATSLGSISGLLDGPQKAGVVVSAEQVTNSMAASVKSKMLGKTASQNYSALTDTDGRFEIKDVPEGRYFVQARRGATIVGQKLDVEVKKMAITTLNIQVTATGSLSGKVTLTGQTQYSGIMVYLAGTSYLALTDVIGNYLISDIPVSFYTLEVMFQGYANQRLTSVEVLAAQTHTLNDMTLAPLSTVVSGRVLMNNLSRQADITVEAYNAGNTLVQLTLTDYDGNYYLQGLGNGTFRIQAEKVNFISMAATIEVKNSSAVVPDLFLSPALVDFYYTQNSYEPRFYNDYQSCSPNSTIDLISWITFYYDLIIEYADGSQKINYVGDGFSSALSAPAISMRTNPITVECSTANNLSSLNLDSVGFGIANGTKYTAPSIGVLETVECTYSENGISKSIHIGISCDATGNNGIWTVKNGGGSIANGIFTAPSSAGTSTLTCTYTENGKTASADLTVNSHQVTSISLNQNSLTLELFSGSYNLNNIGATGTFNDSTTATVTPTWSTTSSVGSINGTTFTLSSTGSAVLTATYAGQTANLTVTVTNPPNAVSSFVALPWDSTEIDLYCKTPGNLNGGMTLVIVRKSGSYPSSATDGTVILTETSPTVSTWYKMYDTSLTSGSTNYYSAFVINVTDTSSAISSAAKANGTQSNNSVQQFISINGSSGAVGDRVYALSTTAGSTALMCGRSTITTSGAIPLFNVITEDPAGIGNGGVRNTAIKFYIAGHLCTSIPSMVFNGSTQPLPETVTITY
ncbi:MAG: hypothetical protein PHW04_18715 [Candidatus Wallbacteria bacterium]|nr:hypothetical protein [Candidatus Wallbacteria bacterium]